MKWSDCKDMGKLPKGIVFYLFIFELFGWGIILVQKPRRNGETK